ncbi:MAG: hypothetical protein QOD33_961 [Pyrinomonadaceae bacterium]|jgi:hypothetical protein|nr:hypothetical protein [Pyrinomonadaceae bacterium]
MKSIFGKRRNSQDDAEASAERLLDLRQPKASTSDGLDQAYSANDQGSTLNLQASFGNAAVTRTIIQRKAEDAEMSSLTSASSEAANSATEAPADNASAMVVAAATVTQALIVEDNVETVAAGQMKKSEFLAQLRAAVSSTAADALAGSPMSAVASLYIDNVFAQYSAQGSGQLEGSIRRYAPEAAAVTSAGALIPIITGRVRRSLTTFVATGQLTGVPEGLPLGLPGPAPLGAIAGAASSVASGVADVASSVASGVGSAVSAVGSLLFKEHSGGAREVNDPRAIETQLGSGQSLDAEVRSRMESAFGESFSGVQVHADSDAAGISQNLNARALTVGQHIAFGTAEYQPGTLIGDALIAHELAHVLQQRGGAGAASPAEKGAGEYGSLEADADEAAVGAIVSAWGGGKKGLAKIARNALPSLKSGLRLQRCSKTSSGPVGATRLTKARANFQNKNDHLAPDELARIDAGLSAVSADNLNLWIAFYDYYSRNQILKMDAAKEAKATASGLYATTKPNDDTYLRPDLLAAGFPAAKLGTTLIHEFTHTRHDTNYMGSRDYQEGESYGIEYFLAERAGERTRMSEILSVMSNPTSIAMPASVPALLMGFRSQYATMQGLYEIIDKGHSSHAGSPFVTPVLLTAADARELAEELVDTREDNRGAQLKSLLTWVQANLKSFTIPPV